MTNIENSQKSIYEQLGSIAINAYYLVIGFVQHDKAIKEVK